MKIPKILKNQFYKLRNDEISPEDVSVKEDEKPMDTPGDNMSYPDEPSEADKATMLKRKHIMVGLSCVSIFVIALTASNSLFKSSSTQKSDPPLTSISNEKNPENPAAGLPAKYSDISKYNPQNKGKNNNNNVQNIHPANNPPARSYSTPPVRYSSPSNYTAPTAASTSRSVSSADNTRANQELQRLKQEENQAITSAIAFSLSVNKNAVANNTVNSSSNSTSTSKATYNQDDFADTSAFTLQAGSVIQATLLTGITSDIPNGDVVAQVRQNIYDSQTGQHLLIPQGSRIIGRSGQAGSRGNSRIGVVFNRIILPDGRSINLPDQQAIDGVGYPGMKDKYTQHNGRLLSTGFMTALISAAAQSATGNSSGSDERSPGEEAVSGAVANVLDTMKTIIDRDASIAPTITIRPGFEFSVFINQDLSIPEYSDFDVEDEG